MLVEITPEEAEFVYLKAGREHRYLTSEFRWWFGTQAELEATIARHADLMAKMEAVMRESGHWEERHPIIKKLLEES